MNTTSAVVKLGGNVLDDAHQLAVVCEALANLHQKGIQLVVMHGGGPQASALSRRLGIETNIVGGRRITDAATLEVTKMVLAGQLNVNLTCALIKAGLPAVGLSGVSNGLIEAVRRPPRIVSGGGPDPIDFGHVGDIVNINGSLLTLLQNGGHVPVLNSLGASKQGDPYNINADVAATRVAAALGADHLVLLSGGVRGVLRDKDDPNSRIPSLTSQQARDAIAQNIIQGGMIPKVEESLNVLEQGVGAIHILGALQPGELAQALKAPGSVGTALVP